MSLKNRIGSAALLVDPFSTLPGNFTLPWGCDGNNPVDVVHKIIETVVRTVIETVLYLTGTLSSAAKWIEISRKPQNAAAVFAEGGVRHHLSIRRGRSN